MHPAFSVIFFTVTSGLGYGLLFMGAVIGLLINPFNQDIQMQNLVFGILLTSNIIGMSLVTLGLLSSTLHLSNPKNAWRALFRFKSSWLSKEGVFAILGFPIVFSYVANLLWFQNSVMFLITSILVILIAVMTVFSTAMIYASLKTIRTWNTSLVPTNYLMISFFGGSLSLLTIFAYYNLQSPILFISAVIFAVIAFMTKNTYYFCVGQPSSMPIQSATGLSGKTRLLCTGESSKNFLQKEFGYDVDVKFAKYLRMLSVVLAFLVPFLILIMTQFNFMMTAIALSVHYLGLFVERWLFFAEAKHVVNFYYGRQG